MTDPRAKAMAMAMASPYKRDADLAGPLSSSLTLERLLALVGELRERALALQRQPYGRYLERLERWLSLWGRPDYPYRRRALELLQTDPRFSPPVLEAGLGMLFEAWQGERLRSLLTLELGETGVLEGFIEREGHWRRAVVPEVILHILAGNVPPPTFQSLMSSLLLRSSALLKVSSDEPHFAPCLKESLMEDFAEAASIVHPVSFKGGDEVLERALFRAVDAVVAFGGREALASIRARVPAELTFVARTHRFSFAYLARESLRMEEVEALGGGLARDVAIFDQEGCLSPHTVFVEEGGEVSPEELARYLAERSLPAFSHVLPAGLSGLERAAERMQYLGRHRFGSLVLEGEGGSVVVNRGGVFEGSCLSRVLVVHPVSDLTEVLSLLKPMRGSLQAVALAAPAERWEVLASSLSACGVSRICRPGRLQAPRASWPGDGWGVVLPLLRWVSKEA